MKHSFCKHHLLIFIGMGMAIGMTFVWFFASGLFRFNTPGKDAYPVRGIDVSHHQGKIDWKKVKKAGYDFVFIKATEGGDFQDKRFNENWEAAGKAGLMRGAYHFFTFCSAGHKQAENFIRTVPINGELPHVVDLEFGGNCSTRPDSKTLLAELKLFLKQLEIHYDQSPILYMTYEFSDAYPIENFPNNGIWIRDIFFHPRLQKNRKWIFWQHHNRGRVDGIDGPVDLNVFNGSRKQFDSYLHSPEANQ